MKEGWWLNAESGKYYPVDDHSMWAAVPANAKKLGLSEDDIKELSKLNAQDEFGDRRKILELVMSRNNIRVRGHGNSTTFEFTMDTQPALWAIYEFGDAIGLGPFSHVYIANIRTKENYQDTWEGFKAGLTEKGKEAILRVAKQNKMRFKYKSNC